MSLPEEEEKGEDDGGVKLELTSMTSNSPPPSPRGGISVSRKYGSSSHITRTFIERRHSLQGLVRRLSGGVPTTTKSDTKKLRQLKDEVETEFHTLPVAEIVKRLGTSLSLGLDDEVAQRLLIKDGRNVLSAPLVRPLYLKFLLSFFNGFAPLLWVASFICFLSWKPFGSPPTDVYNLALAVALVLVIVISGLFNFVQEVASSNVVQGFSHLIPSTCIVLRGGVKKTVLSETLVVGDVCFLLLGQKIPSDLRISSQSSLKLDRSMLTGENKPVTMISAEVLPSVPFLQASNIALMGCEIVEGECQGIVITTGKSNQLSKIATLVNHTANVMTGLQRDLNRFVCIIASLAFIFCASCILYWALYLRVQHPTFLSLGSAIASAIAVVVAFVPEGLPLALSMGLTTIARRLCKVFGVLVTRLSIIETLGSMSFLCTDKTGTLTCNCMTVVRVITAEGSTMVSAAAGAGGYVEEGVVSAGGACAAGAAAAGAAAAGAGRKVCFDEALMRACLFCNQASPGEGDRFTIGGNARVAIGGNAIDRALLNWFLSLPDAEAVLARLQASHRVRARVPFSSATKIAAIVIDGCGVHGGYEVIVKGAPEWVLERCSSSLTVEDRARILAFVAQAADQGERIIAIGHRVLDPSEFPPESGFVFVDKPEPNFPLCGLEFVGCVSVEDPPREGVREAVLALKRAGVRIAIVTGDAANTAVAIAKQVGIVDLDQRTLADELQLVVDVLDPPPRPAEASTMLALSNRAAPSAPAAGRLRSKTVHIEAALIVEGRDLDNATCETWDLIFRYREIIFARLTPDMKLDIVHHLQQRGERLGVTGDGVNDSPALKRADVGIAMGSGSDVAREAADVVLLYDNFGAIVKGVQEGRLVFDNLRKVIGYQIAAGCWVELLPVVATFFLGLPQPLSSFLMIVISCITDVFAGVALTLEEGEDGAMGEPPRDFAVSHLVDWQLILYGYLFIGNLEALACFLIWFLYLANRGPTDQIRGPIPAIYDGPPLTFPLGYRADQLLFAWAWGSAEGGLGDDNRRASIEVRPGYGPATTVVIHSSSTNTPPILPTLIGFLGLLRLRNSLPVGTFNQYPTQAALLLPRYLQAAAILHPYRHCALVPHCCFLYRGARRPGVVRHGPCACCLVGNLHRLLRHHFPFGRGAEMVDCLLS